MAIDFTRPGRMMSAVKESPKGHVCVWNANICTMTLGKIWFGDLDLTKDAADLKRYAKEIGEPIYVLREMDARFDTQDSPRFECAVAVIQPSGEMTITPENRYL